MQEKITTKIPGLRLRAARKSDCKIILGLILELAEYEKLAHEVIADANTLAATLFGERRFAEAVLAEYNGAVVGFALFFDNFSTFTGRPGLHLEDLFVQPEFRGKGIGKTLLGHVARLAVERNCRRLEWSVLNWNEAAIRFYKKLGAAPMHEWTTFRLTGETLTDLAGKFDEPFTGRC